MEKKELLDIIEKVRLAYTQAAREYTVAQMVELYKNHLLKEDYTRVLNNLNNHIKKSKYPPTIAELLVMEEDDLRMWGTPVVIEEVPEKTPEEIAKIKAIIARGKKMLSGGEES